MQELFSALSLWLSAHPLITGWYTAIARLLFPVLSAGLGSTEPAWWWQHPPDPLGKYSGTGQIR